MGSTSRASIVVAVPSNGTWTDDFGHCLAMLTGYLGRTPLPGYDDFSLDILKATGSNLPQLRFELLRESLKIGSTHILCLDTDMVFPKDTLHRLISHKKSFVAANCVTRTKNCIPTAVDFSTRKIYSHGRTGLQKVMHVGLAVMLMETWPLKLLRPPFFNFNWVEESQAHCGEDVYFCHKIQDETQAKFYIDHDLSNEVGHLGRVTYTQNLAFEQIKRQVLEDEDVA